MGIPSKPPHCRSYTCCSTKGLFARDEDLSSQLHPAEFKYLLLRFLGFWVPAPRHRLAGISMSAHM